MGVVIYIVVSLILFFVFYAAEGKIGEALFMAVFWPIGLVFLFISLFYGAGKYL